MEAKDQEIVRTVGLCQETAEILKDFEDFLMIAKRVESRVEDKELYHDTQKDYLQELVYCLFDSVARNHKVDDNGRIILA